ncbi:class I SAM-dependent methyltransferase [Methylomonas koyamae]|uniref:class I SAM-dependent methyltransferase n=1 Tax=Methylomonas koyamae TaxID=702114 RepID=UPI000BC35424|nr:methyltransferase domain-containing protein [Methylomonas koyamae]ATG92418.1 methyltransferase type 12 [Methylomonas koyamae]WNB75884.1 methyltransferase domain-containing protein [Methylomonas koyamae]
MSELQRKWDAIYRNAAEAPAASELLANHCYLLPERGNALDLACGLGGNALLLAKSGLNVAAWDVSPVALEKLRQNAERQSLSVNTRHCQIGAESLPTCAYDVIVICRFLDRTLCNAIMAALNPGGLLFYQTFTRDKLDQHGPSNPDYLLAHNELLELFKPLSVVFYQEYARIGDTRLGNRNEACFIGQKLER